MQSRIFGDWLTAYMEYTDHTEAPDIFHYWTGIVTIAGALRRKVWIPQANFLWTPNFYVVLVAPAGLINKSSTLRIGRNLLRQVPGIEIGPNSLTWQRLVERMAQATEALPISGTMLPNGALDPSAEYINTSCLTMFVPEWGSVFKPKEPEFVDVLTDLWDSDDSWIKETKHSGSDLIENPWLNMIAGTTPRWIASMCPQHVIEGGMFSRTIFLYRDKKRKLVPYLDQEIEDMDAWKKLERYLVEDLKVIAQLRGQFALTAEAREFGQQHYHETYDRLQKGDEHFWRLGSYVTRRQGHLHKLAMVMSAAQKNTMQISLNDIQHADTLLRGAEADMYKIHTTATNDPTIEKANLLVELCERYKRIQISKAYHFLHNRMSYHEFGLAVTDAIMSSRVTREEKDGTMYLVAKESDSGEQATTDTGDG